MRHTKVGIIQKIIYIVAGILLCTLIHFPAVSATDTCFKTDNAENNLSDPYRSQHIALSLDFACSMKLYYIDVSFPDAKGSIGLVFDHSTPWHDNISDYDETDDGMRIIWDGSKDEAQTEDGRPFLEIVPDDTFFIYWYNIEPGTTVYKSDLPIVVNSARYEMDGEMKTVEDVTLYSTVTVMPSSEKEVLMISGVESQEVSYTSAPVVLKGNLVVEENSDGVTAEDLTEQFYSVDSETGAKVAIERPTDPGAYIVEYSFENDKYIASLEVPFIIKEYTTVNTSILSGEGEVSAPRYVDLGSDFQAEILPSEGFEVMSVEYNGHNVIGLLKSDNTMDLTADSDVATIQAAFRPIFKVIKGDGGEYTIGSSSNLVFKIDSYFLDYADEKTSIMVDGEALEIGDDVLVEPEKQTVTLMSNYLDTLKSGEHKFEIYFLFDTVRNGVARATFNVVAAVAEEDDTNGANTEQSMTPNTGAFTGSKNGVSLAEPLTITTGIVLALVALIVKKTWKGRA